MTNLQSIVDLLNEVLEINPEALLALLKVKVPCNDALADHPRIQVGVGEFDSHFSLGFLGLLQGLSNGDEYLASIWTKEDPPQLDGFCILTSEDIVWEDEQQ